MTYEDLGRTIGQLVDLKNAAYGDSFHQAGEVLRVLYPNGVSPDQYTRMLYTIRVIDKLFRLATQPEAFGENPAKDIAGYSILMSRGVQAIDAPEIDPEHFKKIVTPDIFFPDYIEEKAKHQIDAQASVEHMEKEEAALLAAANPNTVGNGL